jgi:hypothetical protein
MYFQHKRNANGSANNVTGFGLDGQSLILGWSFGIFLPHSMYKMALGPHSYACSLEASALFLQQTRRNMILTAHIHPFLRVRMYEALSLFLLLLYVVILLPILIVNLQSLLLMQVVRLHM